MLPPMIYILQSGTKQSYIQKKKLLLTRQKKSKNIKILENQVTIKTALNKESLAALEKLAEELA